MQCTFTADTPSYLTALLLGLGAAAIALVAETGGLALALHWRGSLARWIVVLTLPLALAVWCAAQAERVWALNDALIAPGPCPDIGCKLVQYCTPLSVVPTVATTTLIGAGIVLALGIAVLAWMPARRPRVPAWHQATSALAIWPVLPQWRG